MIAFIDIQYVCVYMYVERMPTAGKETAFYKQIRSLEILFVML